MILSSLLFFSVHVKSFNERASRLVHCYLNALPSLISSQHRTKYGNRDKLTKSSAFLKSTRVSRSAENEQIWCFFLFHLNISTFVFFIFRSEALCPFFHYLPEKNYAAAIRTACRYSLQKAYVNGNSSSHFESLRMGGDWRTLVDWLSINEFAMRQTWQQLKGIAGNNMKIRSTNTARIRAHEQKEKKSLYRRRRRKRETECLLKNRTTVKLNF